MIHSRLNLNEQLKKVKLTITHLDGDEYEFVSSVNRIEDVSKNFDLAELVMYKIRYFYVEIFHKIFRKYFHI